MIRDHPHEKEEIKKLLFKMEFFFLMKVRSGSVR